MKAKPFILPSLGFFTNSTPSLSNLLKLFLFVDAQDYYHVLLPLTSRLNIRNHDTNVTESSRVRVTIVIG